jgi:hypothetical protein
MIRDRAGATGAENHMANRDRLKSSERALEQQQARAQDVAVATFDFIAAQPRQFGRFLEMTGIALESIREATRETNFLAGVLDHLSGDESLLLAFCAQTGIDPNEVIRARAVLGGHCWERDMP